MTDHVDNILIDQTGESSQTPARFPDPDAALLTRRVQQELSPGSIYPLVN